MANKRLPGFTGKNYALADKLGYSNENFNNLGSDRMKEVLNKGVKYNPSMIKTKTPTVPKMPAPVQANAAVDSNALYGGNPNIPSVSPTDLYMPTGNLPGDSIQNVSTSGLEQSMTNANNSYTAMLDEQIKDMQSFDTMGAVGLGMQGLGTAMQMGMYGDKKDYLSGSVSALEQATANSEEAHNQKMANTASYGSAFSG